MRLAPLVWREMKLHAGRVFLVHSILGPTVYFVLFGVAFASNMGRVMVMGKEIGYLTFLVPGIMAMQIFYTFHRAMSLIRIDMVTNMFVIIQLSKVKVSEYILAKIVMYTFLVSLQLLWLVLLHYALFGYAPSAFAIGFMLLIIPLGILFWFSIGSIFGMFVRSELTRDVIEALITLPILFSSTVFYSLKDAPEWLKNIGKVNPLSSLANVLRASYIDRLESIDTWSITGVFIFAAIGISLMLIISRKVTAK